MRTAIRLEALSGRRPDEGESICLLLTGLTVAGLHSIDALGRRRCREGLLVSEIGGQRQILRWATDSHGRLRDAARFRDVLLFHGRVTHGLQARLNLIESDREAFEKFQRRAGPLLNLAGSLGALATPYGPAAGASAVLLEALLAAAGGGIADDLEFAFAGDLLPAPADCRDQSAARGSEARFSLERPAARGPGIRLDFLTRVLPPPLPTQQVCLMLEAVEFGLRDRFEPGGRLQLEGRFGSGRHVRPLRLDYPLPRRRSGLGDLARVRDYCVYAGECRGILSFHLGAAVLSGKAFEDLAPVTHAGRALTEALARREGDSGAAVRRRLEGYDAAAAAAQSLLNLLMLLSPEREEIGALSGMLQISRSGEHEFAGGSVRRICPGKPFEYVLENDAGDCLRFRFRLEVPGD